ncbi:MAG: hypothetical protein HY071_02170 [Chloroflexi bacterium]|nr:hypothetical protein [Chloroflexota bacterium]
MGTDIDLVGSGELASALRIEHTVAGERNAFTIELADGRNLTEQTVGLVLNRHHPPSQPLATEDDREYAYEESLALFASWMNCLPGPVLNRPVGSGPRGPYRSPAQWRTLARRAGFETRDPWDAGIEVTEERPTMYALLLYGESVGVELPAELRDAARALCQRTQTELVEIRLVAGTEGWTFTDASLDADLRLGGDALLARLRELARTAS